MLEEEYIFLDSSGSKASYIKIKGNTIVEYVGDSETLAIPNGIRKIEALGCEAFGNESLKKLLIPASVKEIHPLALSDNFALSEIVVSKDNSFFHRKIIFYMINLAQGFYTVLQKIRQRKS